MSQIASYQGREDGASNSLEVYGAGSRLDLSQVTSLAGGYGLYLDAYEGGEIDLSNLPEIASGTVYVTAEDNGSQVNLSSLTSFVDESGYSELAVRDGGEILADNLTTLEGVDLSVRGNSSIDTSQITSLSDSSVRVEGTTIDLSGLDSIDGLNFYLGDGATLDLSQIASYQGREDGASNSLGVYGAGSSLDLSQVTSLAGGYGVYLDAYEGGEIDLSSLPEIASGTVYVTAEDNGSQVNLSSLTSFVDESGYSELAVRDGGSILADNLTSLDGVDLLSDNGNLSLAGLNSYVGDNSVKAVDGGRIGLNDLSEIVGGLLTVSADGNGSTIELSAEVVESPFLPEESNGGQILVGGKTLAELPFIIAPDEVRENTTWNGLVKIFADVIVPENVTLTVAPGTRIIFYQDSIGLDVQGTLNVEGTVEQTVTFTRWPDGSENSDNSTLSPGDWQGISFTGANARGNLEGITIRYADRAIEGIDGAKVNLSNAVLENNNQGIYVYSPLVEITAENTLNVNHSIFYNPDGEEIIWETDDPGLPDLSQNGNLSVNPLFVNREGGNYQLLAGSPAIDAGRGTDASNLDLLGQSRYDDLGIANSGEGIPDYVDIGTYEYQGKSLTADLAVMAIANPNPDSLKAGNQFTTNYTVSNLGRIATSGNWVDRIYLSGDPYISPDDTLLTTVAQTESLELGNSYTETLNLTMPSVAGPQYLLVLTDAGETISEVNETNNLGVSSQAISVNIPELTIGGSVTGQVTQGQWTYFQIEGQPGETIKINLDGSSGNLALYSRFHASPNALEFDQREAEYSPDRELRLIDSGSGTYYLGVYGQNVSGTADFTLTAEIPQAALYSVTQTEIANTGEVTLELIGDGFSSDDVIKLVAPNGTELTPISVFNQDSTRTYATFDLNGLAIGTYDVFVDQSSTSVEVIASAIQLTNNFSGEIIAPSSSRPGREIDLTIEYANTSGSNIFSPLLTLNTSQELEFLLPGEEDWISDDSLSLLALSQSGFANILRPSETQNIELKVRTPFSTEPINFQLFGLEVTDRHQIDWDALESETRPPGVSNEGWAVVWDNVQAQTGDNWGDFVSMLGENAAYLAKQGELVYNTTDLFAFEVLQASGLNPNSILASATDAFRSTPGVSLGFGRVYNQDIASRYDLGILGRGWNYGYDYYLETTEDGDIRFYDPSGSSRLYLDDGNGGYKPYSDFDFSTLVKNADNTYTLTESDGLVYQFNPDLSWHSLSDADGNSLTANYTNNQLTKISHSSGQYLQLEYNSNGRLTRITDDLAQEALYQYDASGEHLTQVTDFNNQVITYTYNSSNHALTIASNEVGNQVNYSYDTQQRLNSISLNQGAEAIAYSYDNAGTVTITDTNNNSSHLFFDRRGMIVAAEDPLGRRIEFDYALNGNITKFNFPNGTNTAIAYDRQGYPNTLTDGLGNTIDLQINPLTGNLQWLRDAKDNTLHYDYDPAGNLTAITYPDSSVKTFTVDGEGNFVEYVNRRGDKTGYTYNADGILLKQQNADGTSYTYTYDAIGNLLSATDAQGQTSFEYDANNNLTKILYPNGRYLEYSYNAAGDRTQIKGSDGYTVNYGYDDVGRLTSLTDGNNDLIVSYAYDSVGHLSREDKGNNTYTVYDYDRADRLLSIVHYAGDGSINSRYDYTSDNVGQISNMTTPDGEWSYGYDANGQLINADFDSTNTAIEDRDITYIYDASGNRIQTVINGVSTDYSTNNLNQYNSVGSVVYDYDTDGNLISKTEGDDTWTYEYNSQNQLVKVIEPNGIVTEYEYNAFGDRIATVYDGVRTEYLIEPFGLGDVVAEYDSSGNLIASYSHGLGLETRFDGSHFAYYDFNQIGSTIGLTDASGIYVNRYSYLPFGEDLSETEAITNPFEFVGEFGVMEEANGLDFMRARYYDSLTGRFISEDRVGLQGGNTNLYGYALNSPTVYTDPSGNFVFVPVLVAAGIGALIGAGTDAAIQGTLIATGLQSEFSWTSLGISAGLGALGGGGTALARNTIVRGGSLLSRMGTQFSHSIPNRTSWAPNWLLNWRRSPIAQLNGEFVSPRLHYAIDPFAKGGRLIGGGSVAPVRDGLGWIRFPSWRQTLNRIPSWIWASVALPLADRLAQGIINIFASLTPEDKFGPIGYDVPVTPENDRYIKADQPLEYRIDFWNKPDATVPTQVATIKDTLDPNLDWNTLNLTKIGFLKWNQDIPGGQSIDTRIDMRPDEDLAVDVTATFNPEIGEIVWTFEAVDPVSGDPNDVDPSAGFLPPFNEETQYELGWVEFTVEPKDNLPTGTEIQNQAFVQFDLVGEFNPAPKSDPWLNTIDADPPTSTVEALPATTDNATFTLKWSGSDSGSGISSYDLYVSVDGSPFNLWLNDTTNTESIYTGESGHTYSFYSVATDNVGNPEALPTQADAVTSVVATFLFGTMGNDNDTENPALKLSSPTNTYIVFSGAGDDTIDAIPPGSTAKDRLYAGSGQDNSIAGTNDRLLGGEGNDTLKASSGGGNNRLYGGGGDDLLLAGSNDILCGGAGRDKFLLANAQLPNNSNLVLDFEVGSDLLSLSGLSIEGNPVSFNDLSFTQGDRGTQLSIPDLSPDPLAIFLGITADTLNNSFNFELS